MKMQWMMMACLSLLGATACDLPDKNIGDETQGDSADPGDCTPGDTVPADDGCNTCECLDDGTIGGCTEIGCEPPADTDPFDGPELSSCEPATPFDALTVQGGTIEGDTLTLDVAYTGCGPGHPLGGCWDGEFLESFPVQVAIDVAHDDLGEACDAFPSDTVDIDLTPLRESYQELYEASGTISINVAGLDGAVEYSF